MKKFGQYLMERKKGICFYIFFSMMYFVVAYLYGGNLDATWYAFEVTTFVAVIVGVIDFWNMKKKWIILEAMEQQSVIDFSCFPKAEKKCEQLYQAMLQHQINEKAELLSAVQISRQEMKDYYGMWVHQIKTPIAALHILLQSEELSVRAMQQELFKIEQYVEMVLAYLRMEEMGSDLCFAYYSLDDIVKQAVRKYSQMFILKRIRLEYEPLEIQVLTDEKWLVFVIEQLLSNALKYTKEGHIRIAMEDDQLVIEDTGIGIWTEDLPRVFERGFTGYNGRNDKKSTGIGLYLCKCVLDKLNHRIRMESEVERGTKVFLNLKRHSLGIE